MNNTRSALAAIVVIAGISSYGVAFAQTPAPPIATAPAPIASSSKTSEPSATKRVETWTKKQWDAAKKEWAKDNAKWTDCQKQSDSKKLSGRKSWSFIYQCMTS